MNDSGLNVCFDQVRRRELDEIAKRRCEAGLADAAGSPKQNFSVAENLVGLALSGGRVRSGSFSLGLIQSLYRQGVFKHIDYMLNFPRLRRRHSLIAGGPPDTNFNWKEDDRNLDRSSVSSGSG